MSYRIVEEYSQEDVEDYRSLKGNQGQFLKGIFIAESPKIVDLVLCSRLEIVSAYLTREYFTKFADLLQRRNGETLIYLAQKPEMESVVGYQLHQGVMLACRIPAEEPLEAVLRRNPSPLIVALDGIADAENMGAIIRNCAAFGVDLILLDERSCNPWLRRSVRVSMGTIVELPFYSSQPLADSLKELRSQGLRIVAAARTAESVSLENVEKDGGTVLLFGSEGWGIRKELLSLADTVAAIPMAATVDSLNVATANAIMLYQWYAGKQ